MLYIFANRLTLGKIITLSVPCLPYVQSRHDEEDGDGDGDGDDDDDTARSIGRIKEDNPHKVLRTVVST